MRTQKLLGHVVSRNGISKSPELVDKFSTLFKKPITGPEDTVTVRVIQRLGKMIMLVPCWWLNWMLDV